jgi:signal transduction histidine kinase/CheY-like chemotaxis protein
MRANTALLLLFTFLSIASGILTAQPIEVSSDTYKRAFYGNIKYLEAAHGQYSIDEIISLEADKKLEFKTVPYGANFPFPTKAYWLYFDIANTENNPLELYLCIENPNLSHIYAYRTINGQVTDSTLTGEVFPRGSSDIMHLNYLYRLRVPAQGAMRIYLYAYNHTDEIFIPLSISSPERFVAESTASGYYRILRTGMLIFVILAMLFLAVVTRSRQSVYFLMYVLCISMFLTGSWGVNRIYLFSGSEFIGVHFGSIFIVLSVMFAQYFNQLFVDTRNSSMIAHRIMQLILVLAWIALASHLLPSKYIAVPQGFAMVMAAIASLAAPICSLLTFKKQPRASFYLLLSSAPILATVGMYIVRFYGVIQSDSLLYGFDTAFVIELVVLMFGLIDKYREQLLDTVSEISRASVLLKDQKERLERSNEALKRTIEEKEAMQQKLLQVHKLETIGKLAGGIAHDFNNLLTPIIGYTEMCMDTVEKESEMHEDLNIVLKSSKRAKDLVNQILTFSKHFKEQVAHVQVVEMVEEVVGLLKSIIPSSVVIKHRYDDEESPTVYADPTQIHQILMNVCTNAYHAIENEQGVISIEHVVSELTIGQAAEIDAGLLPGKYVLLSISDTGKGMDAETVSKIFDPFFTTKETGMGTGLGLSVVHGIVKKLKGAIKVDSRLSMGTNITIYLPLSADIGNESILVEGSLPRGGNGAMLVLVDDEINVLNMLRKLLERNGYVCASFSNAPQALEFIRSNGGSVSLLITDQTMPQMKGNELSAEVSKLFPKMPILLATGYSETLSVANYSNYGITDLLLKPIEHSVFLERIALLISAAGKQ